ncbi:hypothetical protein Tco_1221303 [Tanacetum coccineum]
MADLIQNNLALEERLDKQGTRLYNLENLNIPHKVSQEVDEIVTYAVDWPMQAPLRVRFRDLPIVDMKEIIQQRMFKDDSYIAHTIYNDLYEALQKSLELDYSTPHHPPPPAGASGAPGTLGASGSSQLPPPPPLLSTSTSGSAHQQGNKAPNIGTWTTFLKRYCQQVNKTTLTQADFKGQAYEVVKAFYPDVVSVSFQMEDVTRKLTDQLTSKGSCPALSISKMKAASYPDFGLELLVPEQMWIDDVCTYDISAKYGISHWWFTRQKFYIDRHDSLDFEDLNLLLLQGHLDHLSGSDKRMLSTVVKLWTQNLDATGYKFKHDYTIIESPRVVVFPVNNNERKIMRFNEIYKFSDGTLTHILEAQAYRVKEFKIKRLNLGMNTRFWTKKDVIRSNEFIAAIKRRLKTRRIYRNLECFVGGRVRDIDYRLLQRTE